MNVIAKILLTTLITPNLWASAPDARSPLKYPSSFHSMIVAEEQNTIQMFAGYLCVAAVKNRLAQNKNFASKVMRDHFTIKLKDYPVDDVRDGVFFHYTNASPVIKLAQRKSYGDLFSHPRQKYSAKMQHTYNWFFYVAADEKSSRSYGEFKMRVTFAPDTLILQNSGDMPGNPVNHKTVNKLIEDELISDDYRLKSCAHFDYGKPWYNSILVLLAAEANGIGLISYLGIGNVIAGGPLSTQWLQVLGPWAIQNVEHIQ